MHDDKFNHGSRGEFRGDFTRDTFDPLRHFSRVLMQQGRVQLDADWNEQVSIFTHYMRSVVRDIGSEHWGPNDDELRGFEISLPDGSDDLLISPGRYYVQGILCEVDGDVAIAYSKQPEYPILEKDKFQAPSKKDQKMLVYLDVWERHLSHVEDNYMREKALGGPDTAARAKIVWQVKLLRVDDALDIDLFKSKYQACLATLDNNKKLGSCLLRARARKNIDDKRPCLTFPEARYRGAENQLYRVEIHKGGAVVGRGKDNATFKWSRENGSVIFPITKIVDNTISLEHLGQDSRFSLKSKDWVEIVDDDYVLQNRADPLLQVLEVDNENFQVTLSGVPTIAISEDTNKHPYLRRWDQQGQLTDGVIPVTETNGEDDENWLTLEDGVQVQFLLPLDNNSHFYHTGNYWLIPARTVTGDVEWPGSVEIPSSLRPHGVLHHYAPLALITFKEGETIEGETTEGKITLKDLRRKLTQNWV